MPPCAYLSQSQETRAVQNMVSWYWSVGGIRQPFGLLAGNLRGRRNWRYAMSDHCSPPGPLSNDRERWTEVR